MLSTTNIICEDGDDKNFVLDIQDPCDIVDYDFIAQGTTKIAHCGCEQISSSDVDNYVTVTETVILIETV